MESSCPAFGGLNGETPLWPSNKRKLCFLSGSDTDDTVDTECPYRATSSKRRAADLKGRYIKIGVYAAVYVVGYNPVDSQHIVEREDGSTVCEYLKNQQWRVVKHFDDAVGMGSMHQAVLPAPPGVDGHTPSQERGDVLVFRGSPCFRIRVNPAEVSALSCGVGRGVSPTCSRGGVSLLHR